MARQKSVNFSKIVKSASCVSKERSNFIHWSSKEKDPTYDRSRSQDLSSYDIACVGASSTWGMNCDYNETWPYYLEQQANITCGNFSENGIDHFTVAHNAEFVLKNYKTNILLIQLGPYDFSLPKRYKINDYYLYRIVKPDDDLSSYREWCARKYNLIRKIVSKKLLGIKKHCGEKGIKLHLLYSDRKIAKYDSMEQHFLPFYINDFGEPNQNFDFANQLQNVLR